MRMILFWGGIGALACFFSILAIPFARIPLTMDAIMLCVLYPFDFFLGSMAFFIGFISHSLVLHQLSILRNPSFVKRVLGFLIYLLPIVLVVYSVKVVIMFFLLSLIFAKLPGRLSKTQRKSKIYLKNY